MDFDKPGRCPDNRRRTAATTSLIVACCLLLQSCAVRPAFTVENLTLHNPPRADAAGITVTWMGVTTLIFTDGATTLLTDGYFTRVDYLSAPGPIAPDRELIEATLRELGIASAAAVMVVHSHFDHALDAPVVAELTGATLLGSESTANIGRGLGLPEPQIRVVVPGEPMHFGRFTVTFFISRHWPLPEPYASTMLGQTIDEPLTPPAPIDAYKDGDTYSILIEHPYTDMLVQGSAGYLPGALQHVEADIVFLGTGGLGDLPAGEQDAYYREIVTATGADRLFPVHWEIMTTPPGAAFRPDTDFRRAMTFLDEKKKTTGVDFGLLPRAEAFLIETQR